MSNISVYFLPDMMECFIHKMCSLTKWWITMFLPRFCLVIGKRAFVQVLSPNGSRIKNTTNQIVNWLLSCWLTRECKSHPGRFKASRTNPMAYLPSSSMLSMIMPQLKCLLCHYRPLLHQVIYRYFGVHGFGSVSFRKQSGHISSS